MVRLAWFSISSIILSSSTFVTYALPSSPALLPRDVAPQDIADDVKEDLTDISSNSSAKYVPLVSASAQIKTANGVDITSSFQIKVFHQNATTRITNQTGDSNFNDRRGLTIANAVRIMNECPSNETFVESHCTPQDLKAPLQAFEYSCSKTVNYWHALTNQYMGQRPAVRTRKARCSKEELCVDGFGTRRIASCVHNELFSDFTSDKNGQVRGMTNGEVFDAKKMYTVMALQDQSVAIKARKLGIDVSGGQGKGGTTQSKNCVNCVDLETDLLEPGMDSLKIEATLMSTGAVAGVLWLALG